MRRSLSSAAQEFAIRYPQRCRTLTLAATCAGFVMVPGAPRVWVSASASERATSRLAPVVLCLCVPG